jgi:MFS family permease
MPDAPPQPNAAPRTHLVLAGHIVFTLLNSVLFANIMWLMPMLVRLQFGSDDPDWKDWQMTFVTAAIPTCLIGSIFWGEFLQRVALPRYVLTYAAAATLPLFCVAAVQNYPQFLICHILGCIGLAGWMPLDGKLLKDFYPDHVRGRMFGIINVVRLGGGLTAAWFVGSWLEESDSAFRVFFVVATALQVMAITVLLGLLRYTHADAPPPARQPRRWRDLVNPILHMHDTLRANRVFFRYEAAFMTYGAAFMICEVLLPVLCTDRIHMRYEGVAHNTQVIGKTFMIALMFPMGWLLDRLGPVRTSGISFGVLALYPALLIFAHTDSNIAIASSVWGMGLAGVLLGWTLGPVSLAPSADAVPRYAAIHTTLVGLRGVVFQGLGMAAYKWTGSFTWPLLAAALFFAWAAYQMYTLHGSTRRPATPTPEVLVHPIDPEPELHTPTTSTPPFKGGAGEG